MIKQLASALILLLGVGLMMNGCDDSSPTFQNPDPLDTGSNSAFPDSLLPDTSGGSGPPGGEDPGDTSNRLRLAITAEYDSSTTAQRLTYPEGATVKLFADVNNDDVPIDKIAEVETKKIATPPDQFESETSYPNPEVWAIFQNMDERIKKDKIYYVQVEEFEWEGRTLVTKGENTPGDYEEISLLNESAPWVEKITFLQEK